MQPAMRSAAPADSSSAPPRVEIPPYMEPEFAHATEHAAALSHRPLQSRMPLASPCTTAAASALFHVTQQRLQSIETPRHEHEQRIESLDEHKYERECEQQEKSTDARPSALTTSAARGDAAERRPAAGTSASPSGGDVKKRNVGIPKFLRFLFQMLEFEDRAIISWSHKGTAFQIRQPDELAERVLPKYFKHNKVSSFQRQLNYFGFKKWTKTQTNICTFSHPHFIRGEKEKMKLIKRKERGSTGHPASESATATSPSAEVAHQQSKRKIVENEEPKVRMSPVAGGESAGKTPVGRARKRPTNEVDDQVHQIRRIGSTKETSGRPPTPTTARPRGRSPGTKPSLWVDTAGNDSSHLSDCDDITSLSPTSTYETLRPRPSAPLRTSVNSLVSSTAIKQESHDSAPPNVRGNGPRYDMPRLSSQEGLSGCGMPPSAWSVGNYYPDTFGHREPMMMMPPYRCDDSSGNPISGSGGQMRQCSAFESSLPMLPYNPNDNNQLQQQSQLQSLTPIHSSAGGMPPANNYDQASQAGRDYIDVLLESAALDDQLSGAGHCVNGVTGLPSSWEPYPSAYSDPSTNLLDYQPSSSPMLPPMPPSSSQSMTAMLASASLSSSTQPSVTMDNRTYL